MTSNSANHANPHPTFGLLNPVQATTDEALVPFSDQRILENAIAFEQALLEAFLHNGIVSAEIVDRLETIFGADQLDIGALVQRARLGGNFAIDLVKELKTKAQQVSSDGENLARYIHPGATSQDVIDTALVLSSKQANSQIIVQLLEIEQRLATLSEDHRDTVAIARTLTQQSSPTTYGVRFARWLNALIDIRQQLQEWNSTAPVQFGGASGDLAATVAEFGEETTVNIRESLAKALNLRSPLVNWHTVGRPFGQLVSIYAELSALFGTVARNVSLWTRTEIAEVQETLPEGAGSSSSMPHKANPVSTVLLNALTQNFPPYVSQIFTANTTVDERPDGAWHAEWPVLQNAVISIISIVHTGKSLLEALVLNTSAIERNLQLTHGLILSERITKRLAEFLDAAEITKILETQPLNETSLISAIKNHPYVSLTDEKIQEMLDPSSYVGLARQSVEEVLSRRSASNPTAGLNASKPESESGAVQ